jgi:hypothetical protein
VSDAAGAGGAGGAVSGAGVFANGGVRARALCEQLMSMLIAHGVHERRDRPEMVDHVLHGLLHGLRLLHRFLPKAARRQLLAVAFDALFALPALDEARALGADAPPQCKTVDSRVEALALLAELGTPT